MESIAQPEKTKNVLEKENELRNMMHRFGCVLVAYSGGVDSSYLALIAHQELGDNALAVLGVSPSVSKFQIEQARTVAKKHGIRMTEILTFEIELPEYVANNPDRCFFCKSELYRQISTYSERFEDAIIFDGTNFDDADDYRPGREAAKELGVRSPLEELRFSKEDIRERSLALGLEGWNKPASPCLASRIPHSVPVTIERLSNIERAEAFLREIGFVEFRVRAHDSLARIEISKKEMVNVFRQDVMENINQRLNAIGFEYITLDLEGFRSGSLNPRK
ncbi:MAG: ATP-dependent sacrificial sulfur transferase LarE [Pyrinomonadaceae bacterium]